LLDAEDLALLRILAEQAAQVLSVAEVTAALAAAAGNAREPEPEVSLDGLTAPLVVDDASDEGELARAVCEAVVAEVEPGRVLAGALAAVGPALGASSAAVFLRDPAGELAREAEWCDEGGGDRVRLALGVGLTGTVLETGRPVVTDDPSADPRFQAGVDTPANERPGPLMCLPLVFRGKTLGVFRAFPATAGQASPRVGEVLGAALSAAVRTVLLYRSLVESIEEVARVRREARDPSA
jgi:GAF domain-containing protein